MKKINPNEDSCEAWKLDTTIRASEVKENCYSCFYNLFAICWIQEATQGHDLVLSALHGNQGAKRELHRIIEKE